jgi:tripartite-type tricarboxylate transporter receptor subunit TctC
MMRTSETATLAPTRQDERVMKFPRRQFLHVAMGAAALPALPHIASAQAYPTRPVRLILGFSAGGSASDIVARLLAQWLSERLGQPFVVENRPGAATNIATEAVVRAPPDGYTLLFATATNALNAALYDNLDFNFIRDIAPVAGTIRVPFVVLVNPSVPARTVPELIAYAKANPGKLNMASTGTGSSPHVYGELFKAMAGVNMLHVPYRGNPFPDLLAGQVQVFFISLPPAIELVRTGKLPALAVTTATRQQVLPDVPTVGEFVPGYEASAWQGIGAPRNTPVEIIEKLNNEINAALADPKMKAQLESSGGAVLALSPADFGRLVADETERWGKVIRAVNIRPD